MKHTYDCFCIKCQEEDQPQRPTKLLVTAAIAVLAYVFFTHSALAADNFKDKPLEPVLACFGQASVMPEADGGLALPIKFAVDLCQGVTSIPEAMSKITCFNQAFKMFKLPLGVSVELCRKGGSK